MTKPPNSSCTGSQTVLVKKENPYFSMAGQALRVREVRIAINNKSVKSAQLLATHPKILSATGPLRARLLEGAKVMERSWLLVQPPSHRAACGWPGVATKKDYYLKETALPAGSLISPQDFWIVAITSVGIGT